MGKSRGEHARSAHTNPAFTVLNYGFSSDPEDTVIARDEPEFYCLRLYEHTLRSTPLAGADVLELGCGRGGGVRFIARTYRPRKIVGIDANAADVWLARTLAALPGADFAVGGIDEAGLADGSFDVVLNIDATRPSDDRPRSFIEAFRVLRPGGYFCYTSGCWADHDCTEDLLDAGFELVERREITDEVLRALRRDSARREAIFDTLADRVLRDEYKDRSGVVGSGTYRRFAAGQTRYYSHRLRRPRVARP